MKHVFTITLTLLLFAIAIAACGEVTPPRDALGQMVDAQFRATESAMQLKKVAVEATSRADATRQYLILQAQQTRIAQDAQATATAQSVQSTATAQAAQITKTVQAQAVQQTATVHAQSVAATGTAQSVIVQATQQSASATAVADAANAQATRVSASATATANAASAQATQVSANATATVVAANVLTAQEKAEWERRLESSRAVLTAVLVALGMIALGVIVGFAAVRFVDAFVLRARVIRDKTGTVFVIGEKDREGRQTLLVPGRSPGAAIAITPPEATPLQIEAQVVDEETTKRDQAVSLMIAANYGNRGNDVLDELTAGDQIRFVDEPPAQLVSGEVKQLIDGDWRRGDVKMVGDGSGD
jgi:hypothetical protein